MKHHLTFLLVVFISYHGLSQTEQDTTTSSKFDSAISVRNQQVLEINNQIKNAQSELEKSKSDVQEQQDKLEKLKGSFKTQAAKIAARKQIISVLDSSIALRTTKLQLYDSLINRKDSLTKIKDSVIAKKNTEIENQQKKADSTQKVAQKTITTQQALIAQQEDSLEVIAKIMMRDSIKIYISRNDSTIQIAKVPIKQVNIRVREGMITEIILQTDSGSFRNKNSIIDLVHIERRGGDHLNYVTTTYRRRGQDLFVFLDDVINYNPIRSFSDIPYTDFDVLLVPTDNIYNIKESTSINTYFEVAAFTDIKGISGDANGIAQFTADAKFITNTINFKNTSIIPGHFVSFQGGLSKFDNDFKGSVVYHHDSVSRKDLLQRAIYRIGIKANLLRVFSPPTPRFIFNDMQLNVGFNFAGSRILDTVIKASVVVDSTYRTVTQNHFYIEPRIVLSRHRNFSMALSMPFHFITVKESASIKNKGIEYWATPSISLMYFGKRDSKSRLFFRYYHWINLKNKAQAFSQMQLGYAVNLTDVWNNNK